MEEKTLCPTCNREISPLTVSCRHCGQRLRSMNLSGTIPQADLYEIVPDGQQFAVSLRGDIKVHGLSNEDLPRAHDILDILNSMIDDI